MYSSYEGPTVLGIPERWERVLCYALGWISGLVFLIVEQRNHNVRRHAAQSTIVFGSLNILYWLAGLIGGLLGHIWVIGWLFFLAFGLIAWIIGVVALIAWIGLMIMAYSRPNFVLPFGSRYERLLG
jgi:uncharacterized membrane protein